MRWFKRKPNLPDPAQWEEIVQAYGAVLAAKKPCGVGCSWSESDLPFDKASIKAALTGALSQPDLSEDDLGALGVGYIELAAFQPNGGKPTALWKLVHEGIPEAERDTEELKDRIALEEHEEKVMMARIQAERHLLAQEWQEIRTLWARLHSVGRSGAARHA